MNCIRKGLSYFPVYILVAYVLYVFQDCLAQILKLGNPVHTYSLPLPCGFLYFLLVMTALLPFVTGNVYVDFWYSHRSPVIYFPQEFAGAVILRLEVCILHLPNAWN